MITFSHISKTFKTTRRNAGFGEAVKALFHREYTGIEFSRIGRLLQAAVMFVFGLLPFGVLPFILFCYVVWRIGVRHYTSTGS